MFASEISTIVKSIESLVSNAELKIVRLLTDSRSLTDAEGTIFFAIPTKRNNGVRFIGELYQKGVRNFVLSNETPDELKEPILRLEGINCWLVKDVVLALQLLAGHRRKQFDIPVVGITGSNGKTIVKDWIVQLLSVDKKVVASPKSYNSQIGVPLSVWQMNEEHQMAVFEAGISQTAEMEYLKSVINPTIGIFTNIGQAHDENFLTRSQKVAEKLKLFTHCQVLIYCTDHKEIHSVLSEIESFRGLNLFTWGLSKDNKVQLCDTIFNEFTTTLKVGYNGSQFDVQIPFLDRASVENAMQCITLMLYLGYAPAIITQRCKELVPVAMRLEMNEGVNNCLLINDGYSLDLNSLVIALDFVQHEPQHYRKTLVMSDFVQSGVAEEELYKQVATLIQQRGICRFIGIGEALQRNRAYFEGLRLADDTLIDTSFFVDTDDFIRHCPFSSFQNETILLKGARVFQFEHIAKLLQRKSHETIMEVNLDALVRNLNFYRSRIQPSTKLMAMVKASSYGAGKVEIANALQFNNVDYLTVAYSDEGVDLRCNGITLPIMVMNPEEASFDNIIKYNLEPDIYSFRVLRLFNETAMLFRHKEAKIPVHIEFDTGMHRLGFTGDDIPHLVELLKSDDCVLDVKSIFSHLACSEDPEMDEFTHQQIDKLRKWGNSLKEQLGNPSIMCHILNSSGITRFPEAQMDMVRLGIGLYGIAPEPDVQAQLTSVSRVKTRVSQVKSIPMNDSVGYNRKWIAQCDSRIAIIPIGYADGLSRRLGYGNGKVVINNQEAPIIGSICMDMCFIDVTDIQCAEGDEVVIFGDARLLKEMSDAAGTIPYEILTSVSPRVKRVYYKE